MLSLAHKVPGSEAMHLALQTRVPSCKELCRHLSWQGLYRSATQDTVAQGSAVRVVHVQTHCPGTRSRVWAAHLCPSPQNFILLPEENPVKQPPAGPIPETIWESRACALECKLTPLPSLVKEWNFPSEQNLVSFYWLDQHWEGRTLLGLIWSMANIIIPVALPI